MAALTITAANMIPTGVCTYETELLAGATITRGQAVYKDTTTSPATWKPADADASALAAGSDGIGISLSDAAATQKAIVFTGGNLGFGAILTVGKVYCVDQTAGQIIAHAELTSTAKVTILGVATTTSNLFCKPWYTGATIP